MSDQIRFQFSDGTKLTRDSATPAEMRQKAGLFLRQKHRGSGFVGTVDVLVRDSLALTLEIDDAGDVGEPTDD